MEPEKKKIGRPLVTVMITKQWHDEYINMLADLSDSRTKAQFCRDVGVDEKSFFTWQARFRSEIYAEANRRMKERRSELKIKGWKRLDNLMDEQSAVGLKAVELFFKLNGDLVDRVESKTELLTPEEKKKRVAEILSRLAKKAEPPTETDEPKSGDDPSI